MADIILQEQLELAVKENTFIKNGLEKCCEGMKYDFRLSDRILKADFKRPRNFDVASPDDQMQLEIRPGEVVFVMTQETLELPDNMF